MTLVSYRSGDEYLRLIPHVAVKGLRLVFSDYLFARS